MLYKQVIDDFKSGKIDRDFVTLKMDNDGGYWECSYKDKTLEENEAEAELYEARYGCPEGYRDIVDVLKAAGVNCDWV